MTVVEERLEKRKQELAETSARIQGYLSELERLNKTALQLQGAIQELTELHTIEATITPNDAE